MTDSTRNDTAPAERHSTEHEAVEPVPTITDDMLVIVPVRNLVLFPGTVVPVAINRDRSLAAAQEAVRNNRKIGFLLQHDPDLQLIRGVLDRIVDQVPDRRAQLFGIAGDDGPLSIDTS